MKTEVIILANIYLPRGGSQSSGYDNFDDVNHTRDRESKKTHPTRFSPVISPKVWIRSQNYLTCSYILFTTLLLKLKAVPGPSTKLLNLTQDHHL